MKSSAMKKIIVKLTADNMYEIDVDADIFDDPFLEAATQAIEQCKIKKYGIIHPITTCWEKKDAKFPKKYRHFNSYWILVNASLYQKAELLREKFRDQKGIDLSLKPISGNVEK